MFETGFDPLNAKYDGKEEVVIKSLKREILNILSSYFGWFDPFCELIQNGLDAVEERSKNENTQYIPMINILINMKENCIAVTDNGIGFEEQQYRKFLAPNFSFKSGKTRGHKGVGSTYLAYGYNYIQISTKSPTFEAIGKMLNARKWLDDENPAGNPTVLPDKDDTVDTFFHGIDRGVSICIKYDSSTYPKDLSWMKIDKADSWLKMLRIKTGLGAIKENDKIKVMVTVIDKNNHITNTEMQGIKYLWINDIVDKTQKFTDIEIKCDELYKKKGSDYKLPAKYLNLNAIYDKWDYTRLENEITLEKDEMDILNNYKPIVYFCYVYSLKIWQKINEQIGLRNGVNALYGGVQLAANNMTQGELVQIPLNRNTGRQYQAHVVVHFDNCSADLGRKGFQKDITDFSKSISKKILDGPIQKMKKCFRSNTGVAPDLMREQNLDNWKKIMIQHEDNNPLVLANDNFFVPLRKISITSIPTREQDVIALFNQLIAGGVIRGIQIMSTNERFTYDGLYKVSIEEPGENHTYDKNTNPLGIEKEYVTEIINKYPDGFHSHPKVLEYKFSLDGLVEDIQSGVKNSNDIGLVVAWEVGEMFKEKFFITSMLIQENIHLRQYHGVTHKLLDISTNEPVMDLILLSYLIQYLNDQEECIKRQEELYEE
ncbi:hypothetical protein DP73_09945 [Desulfosporosinus sp. HMP52]|uniref:ATP-binding protein n=1 Tax=Desulfosporosinus sp. HMP52 TaxID=1487923 RepID=UPI00051FB706|nr:ATP-binding protein [Desulfosporosinus sp. HMP52]KGK89370.1 hypothetical protein DP73_09945 [Desulfosporosinus sp. HMP52]